MDTKDSKIELAKIIMSIENEEFTQRVTEIIKREKEDFWNDLSPSEQREIKQGITELEKRQKISAEEVFYKISR